MARLFISYKREEQSYAFAVRQWLIEAQGWRAEDIFVDVDQLRAGDEWERKLLAEAEAAEAMLFLASEQSLDIRSFCYRELQHANGQILAVTIKGVQPDDERLRRAIPNRARSRQITALDKEPTRPFPFVSPINNGNGSAQLNAKEVENIGHILRDLGIAPNSFSWKPTDAGPYPGLRPLMEGDEALLFGRDIEIRDGLRALEVLRESVSQRALIIQAPSGAGKSSLLRAGLWQRLRNHAGFTALGIVRSAKGVVRNEEWGLITALFDPRANCLNLSRDEIEARVGNDLAGLLAAIADKDRSEGGWRTLLLGFDQAEEMTALSPLEDAELDDLLFRLPSLPKDLDLRLVLTARDDSVDATLDRLARAGLPHGQVATWRLGRLPATRFRDIVAGPAEAARRAGWPLRIDGALADALATTAGSSVSEIGDALPILALALHRMVARRRAPDGGITLRPEEARSFIETAVEDAAKEAVRSAEAEKDDLRCLVIPRLATWDPKAGSDGAAKRQVASAADLFAGPRAGLRKLADALVTQRLLTRSGTAGGAAYEIAHEALLRVAPLGQLIYERRDRFEQARVLEIEARDWHTAGCIAGRLGRAGDRLSEAQKLLADEDFGPDLARKEARVGDYVAACAAHEREQIDKQRRIIGRAFVRPAVQAMEDGLHEQALRLASAGMLLARDAGFKLVPELWGPAARAMFDGRTRAVLKGHSDAVTEASFSPDGRRIVTASHDRTARVWDAASGTEIALLKGREVSVDSAQFSTDGRRIMTTSWNTARVWDAASGNEIALLKGHERSPNTWSFSPDGRRMVATSHDRTARVWDAASGNEIVPLEGHEGGVISASFSPDGRRMVTASDDKTARVWDAANRNEIALLKGHEGGVISASFSPDGRQIVTASFDNAARVWDAASSTEIALLKGHERGVISASFSPDGRRIVTASSDNTARVWDAASGTEIALLKGHDRLISASFSPDCCRIVTASYETASYKKTARVWDAASRSEIALLKGHEGAVNGVLFSPDGRRIVTTPYGNSTARVWDAASGAEIALLKGHEGVVNRVSFSPDGRRIVTASSDNTARVWDAASGAEIALLKGHEGKAKSASFSADGRRIVTAYDDSTARVWDAASDTEAVLLKGHEGGVISASFSPDGHRIVTTSYDKTARVWDARSGTEIALLKGHERRVIGASFSPDGCRIVTASYEKTARVWDAARGTEIALLKGHELAVNSASFSPDGRRVVTASDDDTARLWDAVSGTEIALLKGHKDSVNGASFSPDCRRIVTASSDKTARVWDAGSGTEIALLEGHGGWVNGASFNPDGRRIVTASSDKTARVWDAGSGREIALLKGHEGRVISASFSPDGRRIVTTSYDNTVRVWDAGSGTGIALLKDHRASVNSVSFSPDGRRIVTASDDKTARVWDVSRTEAIVRERAIVLAAALARGVGRRTDNERTDFLMQDAEDDLYAEALRQLGRASDDPEIAEVVAALAAPLHPNCYLSPTQFAEKFGVVARRPED